MKHSIIMIGLVLTLLLASYTARNPESKIENIQTPSFMPIEMPETPTSNPLETHETSSNNKETSHLI